MSTDTRPKQRDITVRVLTERNAKLSKKLDLAQREIATLRQHISQMASDAGWAADARRDAAERERLNGWEHMGA